MRLEGLLLDAGAAARIWNMTDLLERVFAQAKELPEAQQNAIAELWLAELEDERRWDAAFSSAASQTWLEGQAVVVREAIREKRTKLLELNDL